MYKVKQIDFAVRYSFLVYQIVQLIFAANGIYTNNIFRKNKTEKSGLSFTNTLATAFRHRRGVGF